MLCGHCPSLVMSIELPISIAKMHFWQFWGLDMVWLASSCRPPHSRHRSSSLHWGVKWLSLQHLQHWVMGGWSWKAQTEQCLL